MDKQQHGIVYVAVALYMPSMQKLKSKVITFIGALQCPSKSGTFMSMLQVLEDRKSVV